MYYKNYHKLMRDMEQINFQNYMNFFAVWGGGEPFKDLLIQCLIRDVDNHRIEFLAIRNIEVLPEYKNKGYFKRILSLLEHKDIPLYFDDVVSEKLNNYLTQRGYRQNTTEKNNHIIHSRFRIPGMPILQHKPKIKPLKLFK
jgi:hypothetical protein